MHGQQSLPVIVQARQQARQQQAAHDQAMHAALAHDRSEMLLVRMLWAKPTWPR